MLATRCVFTRLGNPNSVGLFARTRLQEMGNSQSTDDMLRQSNIKLLNFGIDWFKQTKAIKHVVKKEHQVCSREHFSQ